jgi:tryptophanyl-tRNA synthetase
LNPIQERFNNLIESSELDDILDEGAERAYAIAKKTLSKAEKALGMGRRSKQ